MCVPVHTATCVGTHIHTYIHVPTEAFLWVNGTPFQHRLSLAWNLPVSSRDITSSTCSAEITGVSCPSWCFQLGSGDLNAGPQDWSVSFLPTRKSHQPLDVFLKIGVMCANC